MNYKKELTKFIEQRIADLSSYISNINHRMNHINSEYPREELIAEIKSSTHSLNGVFINLFGDNYLKRQYLKVKRKQMGENLKEKNIIREEYRRLIECIDRNLMIRKNDITIDIIIEFAEVNNLGYKEFMALLEELGITLSEVDEIISLDENNFQDKVILYIKGIINEYGIKNQNNNRESLEAEKAIIEELSTHFSHGFVIKPTSSIEELKTLLAGVNIPEEAKNRMIRQMELSLELEQDKENAKIARVVINNYYSGNSIAIFETAEKIINGVFNNPLYNLMKKSYKNILSLCKYLSILPEGHDEWINVLHMIDAEISNLGNIIEISEEQSLPSKMRYNYLLKNDSSLQIKEDIDLVDVTYYTQIESEINNLQNGILNDVEELDINGVKVKITTGSIKIAYVEIEGIRMIIAVSGTSIKDLVNQRLNSKQFVSNLYQQIRTLLDSPEEEIKARLYHEVIMRNLDIYRTPGVHIS